MAVPLIITVSPTEGATGGRNTVEVRGNNFRLPPEPPPGKTSGRVPETMQVFFGAAQATSVQVVSESRLLCSTPINDPGLVAVKVVNLDDDAVPIPGEEATKAAAYTHKRPDLTVRSDFQRLIRSLIIELRRQVLANTVISTHTDYDDDTSDFLSTAAVSEMPALILIGPELVENRLFSLNQFRTGSRTDQGVEIRRVPYTVDLNFTLIGVAELTAQLQNLMAATVQFINRTRYLQVLCDPADPSKGSARFEIDFPDTGGDPAVSSQINNSNVRTFVASLVIRGFDMEAVSQDMVSSLTDTVNEIVLSTEQFAAPPTLGDPTVASPFNTLEFQAATGELQSDEGREFTFVWPAKSQTATVIVPDTGMIDATYLVQALVITAPSTGKAGVLAASGLTPFEFTLTSTVVLEAGTTVRISIVDS